MCSFDPEVATGYGQHWRRARKAHVCDSCGGRIQPGETYLYASWVYESSGHSAKACQFCAASLSEFVDHHGRGPTPDWFAEALRDCFEGADKRDDDAALWRTMLAAMLRRGRLAAREVRPQ